MPRTTNIEQLMDLSEIFEKPSASKPMQSLDGYPAPPHMNSSFDQQMMQENTERERQKNSFQGKIRQSSDMRRAVNAGMSDQSQFYVPTPYSREIVTRNDDMDDDYDYEVDTSKFRMSNHNNNTPNNHMSSYHYSNSNLSCMDIARHVKSCPICSKLYENDKSVYIIGIVFLLVVCIILLKKVIENTK